MLIFLLVQTTILSKISYFAEFWYITKKVIIFLVNYLFYNHRSILFNIFSKKSHEKTFKNDRFMAVFQQPEGEKYPTFDLLTLNWDWPENTKMCIYRKLQNIFAFFHDICFWFSLSIVLNKKNLTFWPF